MQQEKKTKYARSTGHDSRCYDIPHSSDRCLTREPEENMASLQALCTICEKNVTAFPILSDNDLKPLLDRNEEVLVRHAFGSDSGSRLHHQWSLGDKEKQNLRKLIDLMVREKIRLGHKS